MTSPHVAELTSVELGFARMGARQLASPSLSAISISAVSGIRHAQKGFGQAQQGNAFRRS